MMAMHVVCDVLSALSWLVDCASSSCGSAAAISAAANDQEAMIGFPTNRTLRTTGTRGVRRMAASLANDSTG
jgi:hypothetical protein